MPPLSCWTKPPAPFITCHRCRRREILSETVAMSQVQAQHLVRRAVTAALVRLAHLGYPAHSGTITVGTTVLTRGWLGTRAAPGTVGSDN